jgi:glutamate/tyrosine decarboxylase-like PLP-dependent enzyme
MDEINALRRAAIHAEDWLTARERRGLFALADYDQMRADFTGSPPESPTAAAMVIDDLAQRAAPGLSVMDSGRFFGWVIGGSVAAARAADWLVTAWDQNNGLNATTPATAAISRQAGEWVLDLLGLPNKCTVGFVTGGCMANFAGLAAGRHRVLAEHGWDVEKHGLQGAPKVRVIASEQRHETVNLALRYLGLGTDSVVAVPTDDQGRIDIDAFGAALAAGDGPTLVALAAGNVNSGSCDDFARAIPLARRHRAWVHVDGAFGLWGRVAPSISAQLAGVEGADSWSTDAHKWLNVPYDCGIVMVADPDAHRSTFSTPSSYLIHSAGYPDPFELVPEFSQRARAVPVWAAIAELGRSGVVEMVERTCAAARLFADRYRQVPGAEVVNEVNLNQVLVAFGDDETTDAVVRAVVESGEAVVNRAVWNGRVVMRTSVSNWRTDDEDVNRTLAAVTRAAVSLRSRA